MTTLITGATGFIGGRLAQRLARESHPVRCLVRASSDISHLSGLDVELVTGDLGRADSLARAVEGCNKVFHCGALVSDWATKAEIHDTNVEGTRVLLEVSADWGVERFVHLSTTDVYGYPDETGTDESYLATRFRNWYAQTKLEAETEVRRVERERGLKVAIARPATVYGPGSKDVVGEIADAIRRRQMILVGGGRAVAGLCHVENLLDALLLALDHQAAPGQAFNVSDGLSVTWKQFVDDLAEGLGCPPVRLSMPYPVAAALGFGMESGYRLLRRATGLTLPALLSRQAVQVLGENQDFSIAKAQRMLGWEPRVGYREGLRETIAWLKQR